MHDIVNLECMNFRLCFIKKKGNNGKVTTILNGTDENYKESKESNFSHAEFPMMRFN